MSRFVSGGTSDAPIERDDEWLRAQQEIEARRLQKLDEGKQQDGRSLFEVLQANKAAKQEAFEEKLKLKNQFRTLDDDEVEFLDSVLESTRAKEAEVRRETVEQLSAFRKQQEEATKAGAVDVAEDAPGLEPERWSTRPRKRRKSNGKEALIGVKLRKTSSTRDDGKPTKLPDTRVEQSLAVGSREKGSGSAAVADDEGRVEDSSSPTAGTSTEKKTMSPQTSGLGLGGYSSDEED